MCKFLYNFKTLSCQLDVLLPKLKLSVLNMQFQFPEFTDRKLQNWQQYSTKEMKIDSTFLRSSEVKNQVQM